MVVAPAGTKLLRIITKKFMDNRTNQQGDRSHQDEFAGKSHGPQGVDKAPGEETNTDNVQFEQEAFKGKKVDADPEKESDRPTDQPSL